MYVCVCVLSLLLIFTFCFYFYVLLCQFVVNLLLNNDGGINWTYHIKQAVKEPLPNILVYI